MLDRVRAYLAERPVKVRTVIAAVLVFAGQYIPAVADVAGSDLAVDAITAVVLVALAGDAVRVSRKGRK